jgi:hypothetical protein
MSNRYLKTRNLERFLLLATRRYRAIIGMPQFKDEHYERDRLFDYIFEKPLGEHTLFEEACSKMVRRLRDGVMIAHRACTQSQELRDSLGCATECYKAYRDLLASHGVDSDFMDFDPQSRAGRFASRVFITVAFEISHLNWDFMLAQRAKNSLSGFSNGNTEMILKTIASKYVELTTPPWQPLPKYVILTGAASRKFNGEFDASFRQRYAYMGDYLRRESEAKPKVRPTFSVL